MQAISGKKNKFPKMIKREINLLTMIKSRMIFANQNFASYDE